MWVIVQVENVSTCVAEEADINDSGGVVIIRGTTARSYPSSSPLSRPTLVKPALSCCGGRLLHTAGTDTNGFFFGFI